MYPTVTSHKQSTDTLPNRWGSDEGEGRRSECPPDPTTTLRSNPYNWIVETRRASGMSDVVRVQPSTFRLGRTAVGQSGQEVGHEVVLPGAASRSSRANSVTPAAKMVDDPRMFDGRTTERTTVGRNGQEVGQEVVLPGAASRSSRATSATQAARMVDESSRFDARTFDVYTTTEGSPTSTDGARCGPMNYTVRDHTTVSIDDDEDASFHRRTESPNSTNNVQGGAYLLQQTPTSTNGYQREAYQSRQSPISTTLFCFLYTFSKSISQTKKLKPPSKVQC